MYSALRSLRVSRCSFVHLRSVAVVLALGLPACGDSGSSRLDANPANGRDAAEARDGRVDAGGVPDSASTPFDGGTDVVLVRYDASADGDLQDALGQASDLEPAMDTSADRAEQDGSDVGTVRMDAADFADGGAAEVGAGSGIDGGAGCGDGGALPAATLVADQVAYLAGVTVSTLAGSDVSGSSNGTGAAASFSNPVSVLVEPSGTLLVCDFNNNRIRRVDAAGVTTTLTSQSNFARPFGLALAPDGTIYVDTDYNPDHVRDSTTGTVWTLDPASGAAMVVMANLGRTRGLAVRAGGSLLLADNHNQRVRLLDPVAGTVRDLAGLAGCPGAGDGSGGNARFSRPSGIVALADGRAVVSDAAAHVLRTIDVASGAVTLFAGAADQEGSVDGPRLSARFRAPSALAIDTAGNIYLTDTTAHRVRRIAVDGTVTTVAGTGAMGFADGPGAQAALAGIEGIAVTPDGKTLYLADGDGGDDLPYNRIRKITVAP